ncbi:adenylate isopentenyltransferase 3, chloroplastic-like [Sesamum indicum]|uniref:adenylate dimethylallyltransferase (ADP/ATP-dependent) n=1 Tax=Sesamum indicum TaxID=4182 RepID=A0A6I9US44_SESIN|nr:adenylate isopentenyltransferase 3, chloroplastic-like [Sesamum indicum]
MSISSWKPAQSNMMNFSVQGMMNKHQWKDKVVVALVNNDTKFRSMYECCFLWMDVVISILHSYVSKRVDQMVDSGLVEEGKAFFDLKIHDNDYGIRHAIGVPEMDEFFRSEGLVDGKSRAKLIKAAIDEIKTNTCKLACCQVEKILRMREEFEWQMHRLNST